MRLRFAAPAARDLEELVQAIAAENPFLAERLRRAVAATCAHLAELPAMGLPGRLAGTREVTLPGLPYVMVYEGDDRTATVLAVFHADRDVTRVKKRRRKAKADGERAPL